MTTRCNADSARWLANMGDIRVNMCNAERDEAAHQWGAQQADEGNLGDNAVAKLGNETVAERATRA